ncbi:restriction endonuclease subunit S [Arthrobacter subterraneus]|uniref:restriction endonuclease subunit S n=1 Tax=Arthrobacter subterraneus TaxID=335973 RepID=UPI00381462F6
MAANYSLVDGDLVVARTGASVGKSYRYRPVDGDLVFAGFLMAVRPDPDVLDPGYLSCIFQSKSYWNWIAAESMRSGQPGLNAQQLGQLEINPPCIEEQRAIAEAVQRVDDLLDALERLIAKKGDVRQGILQELLTGRTRLSGFTGEWRDVELGQLGTFLKGRGITRDDVRSAGVPCIRYGELYTAYHNYARETVSFVDPDVAMSALSIRSGDLLFAVSGETKAEIGMTVAYVGDLAAVAGGDIIVLRGTGFDPIFVGSLLNTPPLAAQKASRGQGDAVVHIGAGALSALRFSLPGIDEQLAIAAVLQNADAEIEALERRLESARAVKVGMMQELLTGRTRLLVKEKI